MPKKAVLFKLSAEVKENLGRIAHSSKEEYRIVQRTQILLACDRGEKIVDITHLFRTKANIVIKWRDRYLSDRIEDIYDLLRSGRPSIYPEDLRKRVTIL